MRKNLIKNSRTLRSKKYSNANLLLFVQTMTSLTLTSGSRASSFPGFSLLLRERTLVVAGHVEISVLSINCAAGVALPLNFVDWTMKYYMG